jgi:hypothetical protein
LARVVENKIDLDLIERQVTRVLMRGEPAIFSFRSRQGTDTGGSLALRDPMVHSPAASPRFSRTN